MEEIWTYCYEEILNLNSSDMPCMMTEPPFNPINNREQMTEIIFEAFNVP